MPKNPRIETTAMVKDRAIRQNQLGYSLIELMVVIAIISVLAIFAYPNYKAYVCDTYQNQAVIDLKVCALALDRYYSDRFTYMGAIINGGTDADNPSLCSHQSPANREAKFNISLLEVAAANYTLQATPVATTCGTVVQLSADGVLTPL